VPPALGGCAVVALVACLVAPACAGRPPPDRDAVIVLVAREPDTLDPRMCIDPSCVKLTRLLYRSLVTIDPETLELVPDLARSITEVDPLRYDVELRRGVTFHSGRALTSADVAATLRSAADERLGSPYRRSYARFRVEVRGPYALTLRLDAPHATVLGDLELPILPVHLARTRPLAGAQADGTGPFRLVRRTHGRLDLAPFARVEGRPPPALAIRFRLLQDDNTRALRLLGGGGDVVVDGVPPQLVPVFAGERAAFRVLSAPSTSFTYLGLNLDDPVLSDPRVRTAIAHAIDRRTLVDGKLAGHATLATGMLAPGSWAYEAGVPRHAYDPARARALLAEAGHPRLALTLLTSTDRFRVGLSRALAWMLGRVGIDVTVRPMELGSLKAELSAGHFQAFTMQIPEILEPNVYDRFFHSAAIPTSSAPDRGANRFRYRSAEADRLIDAGRATTDRAARRRAYSALQRRLAEDLPCIPLWHEDHVSIVAARVAGAFSSRTGRFEPLASLRWATHNPATSP